MSSILNELFKSMIDTDDAPVVICDAESTVVYMNPAALRRYHTDLTGRSIFDCHGAVSRERILSVLRLFEEDVNVSKVYTSRNDDENKDVYMVALRDDVGRLIGYYEKHEYRDRETSELYKGC